MQRAHGQAANIACDQIAHDLPPADTQQLVAAGEPFENDRHAICGGLMRYLDLAGVMAPWSADSATQGHFFHVGKSRELFQPADQEIQTRDPSSLCACCLSFSRSCPANLPPRKVHTPRPLSIPRQRLM